MYLKKVTLDDIGGRVGGSVELLKMVIPLKYCPMQSLHTVDLDINGIHAYQQCFGELDWLFNQGIYLTRIRGTPEVIEVDKTN